MRFSLGNFKSGLEAADFNKDLAHGAAELVERVHCVDVFLFESGHETTDLGDKVESFALHVFHDLCGVAVVNDILLD